MITPPKEMRWPWVWRWISFLLSLFFGSEYPTLWSALGQCPGRSNYNFVAALRDDRVVYLQQFPVQYVTTLIPTSLSLCKLLSVKKSGKQSGGLISLFSSHSWFLECMQRLRYLWMGKFTFPISPVGENLLPIVFHVEFLWPEPSVKFNNFHLVHILSLKKQEM